MANYVYSYTSLRSANEEAAKIFENFMNSLKDAETPGEAVAELYGVQYEDTAGWMIDHVGAKWMIVDDADCDHLSATTAWAAPEYLFNKLHEKMLEVDPNVEMYMTYEDEMPNFMGYMAAKGEDLDEEYFDDETYKYILEGWKTTEQIEEACTVDGELDEEKEMEMAQEQYYELQDAWHDKAYEWIEDFYNQEEE